MVPINEEIPKAEDPSFVSVFECLWVMLEWSVTGFLIEGGVAVTLGEPTHFEFGNRVVVLP